MLTTYFFFQNLISFSWRKADEDEEVWLMVSRKRLFFLTTHRQLARWKLDFFFFILQNVGTTEVSNKTDYLLPPHLTSIFFSYYLTSSVIVAGWWQNIHSCNACMHSWQQLRCFLVCLWQISPRSLSKSPNIFPPVSTEKKIFSPLYYGPSLSEIREQREGEKVQPSKKANGMGRTGGMLPPLVLLGVSRTPEDPIIFPGFFFHFSLHRILLFLLKCISKVHNSQLHQCSFPTGGEGVGWDKDRFTSSAKFFLFFYLLFFSLSLHAGIPNSPF